MKTPIAAPTQNPINPAKSIDTATPDRNEAGSYPAFD